MNLVAQLRGGLGNQLFIYASTLGVARRWGMACAFDVVSGFQRDRVYHREFLLEELGLSVPRASRHDSFAGLWGLLRQKLAKITADSGWGRDRWCFLGEDLPGARPKTAKVYLRGLYQRAENFAQVAAELQESLNRTAPKLSPEAAKELAAIRAAAEPVAICMRSFADVPHQHVRVVMPSAYYQRAVDLCLARLQAPEFFVFSDDPTWARSQLPAALRVRVISAKPENRGACEDFALMRHCRHFIIGNGTLHWWGAWAGAAADKTVIVPAAYAQAKPGFYPAEWSRV